MVEPHDICDMLDDISTLVDMIDDMLDSLDSLDSISYKLDSHHMNAGAVIERYESHLMNKSVK